MENEYGTEKEKKELEDLFSKEKGEKVYIDWDLYEGNFSEAMHYSLYERLKNQISKYSYRYKINYWGFEAKTRVTILNVNPSVNEIPAALDAITVAKGFIVENIVPIDEPM